MVSFVRMLSLLALAVTLPAAADGYRLEAAGFTGGGGFEPVHAAIAPGFASRARDGFHTLELGPVITQPFPLPLARAIAVVRQRLEAEPLGYRYDKFVLRRLKNAAKHLDAYYAGRGFRLLPALLQVRLAIRFLERAGDAARPHIVTLARGAELTTRVEINRLAAVVGDDHGAIKAVRRSHRHGRRDLAAGMFRQAVDFFRDADE